MADGSNEASAGGERAVLSGWELTSASGREAGSGEDESGDGGLLAMLIGHDHINLHRGNGGLLVTSHDSMPLFFCTEESSFWGRLFLGGRCESLWILRDCRTHEPIVRMSKPLNWGVASATVVLSNGDQLGSVVQTWEGPTRPFVRRLVVSDSTPNHAAGEVVMEKTLLESDFVVTLGGSRAPREERVLLGTVAQPKHGMGVAHLRLLQGGMDPFRANRMRAMLVCATILASDMWWSAY